MVRGVNLAQTHLVVFVMGLKIGSLLGHTVRANPDSMKITLCLNPSAYPVWMDVLIAIMEPLAKHVGEIGS